MMIGANFPDIDVLSIAFGNALAFRRGWTHGVLALVVLPFVLTGLVVLWDRYRRKGRSPVIPAQILLLATISMWTHPTLDWMNSYGMRWLMPFDGTWFYGDSLFIVDPWLLLALGAGVWFSRKRERRQSPNPSRPARIAVAMASAYVVVMLALQQRAERLARKQLASTGQAREKLVVSASPGNPLGWRVHADDGTRYSIGNVEPIRGNLTFARTTLDKGVTLPGVAEAVRSEEARAFMDWARLPFYRIEQTESGSAIRITDARYGANVLVPVSTP
jgi:inner membrane protein